MSCPGHSAGRWEEPGMQAHFAGFAHVVAAIKAAGGKPVVLAGAGGEASAAGKPVVLAVAGEETSAADLEELFTAQREAEWGEFLSDCAKHETELAGEVVKVKLMLAELDEEEQSVDRLRRWYRAIRARDLF